MSIWLRIGGYPATEIAAHSPPTWETTADGGVGEVSWEFALTPRSQHQALKAGRVVDVMNGPLPIARAQMTEPDRTTWECHAFGLQASLRRYLALDGLGNATRNVATAIANAQAQGWPGTNPTPVAGTAAGDDSSGPVMVGQLLDDYAEQTGQRWGVDGLGRVFMRPDPTSPSWIAAPDSAAFGVTDEDAVARYAGRHLDSATGTYQTVVVGSGEPQEAVDLTDRGAITGTAATAILNGRLVRGGRVSWTNGVTLGRDQLTTRGGVPAYLASVTAGSMLRAHGLMSGILLPTPWVDVTIGKTRYTAGEESIYLEPVNTVPRTAVDVWEAA